MKSVFAYYHTSTHYREAYMCFICLKDKASDILPFVATVKESNGRIPSTRGLAHSFLNRSYKGKERVVTF